MELNIHNIRVIIESMPNEHQCRHDIVWTHWVSNNRVFPWYPSPFFLRGLLKLLQILETPRPVAIGFRLIDV